MTWSKTQPAGRTDSQAPAQQPPAAQARLLGTPPRQMKAGRWATPLRAPRPLRPGAAEAAATAVTPLARGRGAAPSLAQRPAACCSHGRPCQVCEGEGGPGSLLAQMGPVSCLKLQLTPPGWRDLPPPLSAETLLHSPLPRKGSLPRPEGTGPKGWGTPCSSSSTGG